MDAQQPAPAPQKMRKVKILKFVGQHKPGDVIELPEDQAMQMTQASEVGDGHGVVVHQKAMMLEDYDALENESKDPNKMTMKDMADAGMKNIVETPAQKEMHNAAIAEDLNLKGVPVSASEPFNVTGGITPPTTVNPKLQNLAGRPHVSAEALFGKKADGKKSEDKKPEQKPEDKKPEQAPVAPKKEDPKK